MKNLKIKVCGMREASNIMELTSLPIHYMGFIFYEKSARHTVAIPPIPVPEQIKKTGVFVNADKAFIDEKIALGIQAVQLHGKETPSLCEQVKRASVEVIKAFGIQKDIDWTALAPYVDAVDYFLFDTSSPQHGGTGRSFDWTILESYPYSVPYFLSGGLDLTNIPSALAITDARLIGLDLNSKFEIQPGLKDIDKLQSALAIIR